MIGGIQVEDLGPDLEFSILMKYVISFDRMDCK